MPAHGALGRRALVAPDGAHDRLVLSDDQLAVDRAAQVLDQRWLEYGYAVS